jgi:hypothetical protein
MTTATETIPCIQCGNCCRVGGSCDWLNWARHAKAIREGKTPYTPDAKFEGVCPQLMEDGRCATVVMVRSGETDDILAPHAKEYMNHYLKGVCTTPELREKQ